MGVKSCYVVLRSRSAFVPISFLSLNDFGPAVMMSCDFVSIERHVQRAVGSPCLRLLVLQRINLALACTSATPAHPSSEHLASP